ncbi:UNVERIFIED_CONTAM: hypothetical protein Slati_2542500 [Sesamum latifolium]|uniref:Uncharacterized protein n=1 Tax=Sesamum latifolium TaxID=2727402 RepID=A0AAW2WK35_9LAMI
MKIEWREVAGSQIARSRVRQIDSCWLAGREIARSLLDGSLVASPPGRWLLARRSRARQIAGCRLTGRELARSVDQRFARAAGG